jgi:hypothetical protein
LIPSLVDKLKAYTASQEKEVMNKVALLESVGWEDYK